MKLGNILRRILGATVALSLLLCSSAITYYISSRVLHHYAINLPMLAVQLLNITGGTLFLFGIIGIMAYVGRKRQIHMFDEALEVLRQIGQGNFNVTLRRDPRREANHLDLLIDSFNEMTQKLRQMETMRQEFISNVSHEIQSPLTSIRGFAQALHNDKLSLEERLHYLQIIETESTRLSRLSDNLLKLTSLESDFQRCEPKLYRLDHQLRNLVLASEPLWLEKGIELEIDLIPVSITADEEMLSQVWVNLIHNSIKFTPTGGSITIDLKQHRHEVEVRISDTGIGISEEDQARVFERFYKADPSRNRASGGSGLGLSIVKKIVETHCGTIQLESKPAVGTQFTVFLPLGEKED